jgi:conjugal transfer pilus assembly protein TraD
MSDLDYQAAFRDNYEAIATGGWLLAIVASLLALKWSGLPAVPFCWMAGASSVMAVYRGVAALRLARRKQALDGRALSFIDAEALRRKMLRHREAIWLGFGFEWDQPHTQRVHEILTHPKAGLIKNRHRDGVGAAWIHGVEMQEKDITLPLPHAEGHMLIVGTTRSGKTSLLRLMVTQAVMRDEAVIIIDPKGDKDLREVARHACLLAGDPSRYVYFHPGFPEQSVRLDPMRNFNRPTELASRVAALIPSETGADPFKAFGHMALNNVVQGLLITMKHPSLIKIRRYLEGGPADLVVRAVSAYCEERIPEWRAAARGYTERANDTETTARGLLRYYHERVQPEYSSPDLEGLLSMFVHNREHFQKMIASLMPIMTMLTSGHLGRLLSPNEADHDDPRHITDTARIIRYGQVAYIGLDSLSDAMVGAALGSILLADLTAVAGDRYNYGVGLRPVNIFIDEAPEVLNDPLIQLLNKGAGAHLRLVLATQTFGDIVARTGSEAKARMVLGNLNNTIVLRTLDAETQAYITKGLPKTRVQYLMRTQGSNTQPAEPMMFSGNQGERLMQEEADLFPAALLGMLPNLEYIAKLSGGRLSKGRVPILRPPETPEPAAAGPSVLAGGARP